MNAPGCQHTDSVSYSTEKEQKTHTNLNLLKHKSISLSVRHPLHTKITRSQLNFYHTLRFSLSLDGCVWATGRSFYARTKRDGKVQIEILKTAYCWYCSSNVRHARVTQATEFRHRESPTLTRAATDNKFFAHFFTRQQSPFIYKSDSKSDRNSKVKKSITHQRHAKDNLVERFVLTVLTYYRHIWLQDIQSLVR